MALMQFKIDACGICYPKSYIFKAWSGVPFRRTTAGGETVQLFFSKASPGGVCFFKSSVCRMFITAGLLV